MIRRLVRFLDQRTGSAPLLRKALRYVFPDHWSFLLGEVALYCFIVLVATGTYLTFFFDDSRAPTTYHGPYKPLDGATMSHAYASVLHISFQVKAGLLIRQTHHWAANVFVAAIVLHVLRVFFTGAFRKPRDLTYLIGLAMLVPCSARGLPRLLARRRPAVRDGPGDRLQRRALAADRRGRPRRSRLGRRVPRLAVVLAADVHRPCADHPDRDRRCCSPCTSRWLPRGTTPSFALPDATRRSA